MTIKLRFVVACIFFFTILPSAAGAAADTHDPAAVTRLWDQPHVADQLLVKFSPDDRAWLAANGTVVLREIPALGLALIRPPASKSLAAAAAELAEEVGVEWVEPNYTFSLDGVPNDPAYLTYQAPYLRRIQAEAAWDATLGRPETLIAVLDTGVDMQHEDLAGAIWTNPGEIPDNGIDDEGNGFIDDVHGWDFADNDNLADDDHGHGTHVAGIAAARINNSKGIAGLAGRATVMPVDVFKGGIGTYEALIRALVYATDNGARVINMSLGASSYSRGEEAAVDYAYQRGVVVVAAAGNSGREERHYPAAHVHAIAVSATTADDFFAGFSTRGDWIDVAAPGSSIYSTLPRNGYGRLSGTSMATPHVAGLAALILSRNPTLNPDQVRSIIETSADDLGPTGRDIYFGAGRINAGRALLATPPDDTPPVTPTPGPGHDIDLTGCIELLSNGGFEAGLAGWASMGAVQVTSNPVSAGKSALHFVGGPSSRGAVTQTLAIPSGVNAALLRFDYRIDPQDSGRGQSPAWPFDDWFTAEWRVSAGQPIPLLRTGNTADTVQAGLQWDRYIYRLEASDVAALAAAGPVSLVFTSQNDSDDSPTDVWLDGVSLCVSGATYSLRVYLPLYYSQP